MDSKYHKYATYGSDCNPEGQWVDRRTTTQDDWKSTNMDDFALELAQIYAAIRAIAPEIAKVVDARLFGVVEDEEISYDPFTGNFLIQQTAWYYGDHETRHISINIRTVFKYLRGEDYITEQQEQTMKKREQEKIERERQAEIERQRREQLQREQDIARLRQLRAKYPDV